MNRTCFSIVIWCAILTCSAQQVYSQALLPFPQPGAVYTEVYRLDGSEQYVPTNYSCMYTGDTLVGTYTYAKIKFFAHPNWSTICMYYDNGRVYLHDSTPSPVNPTGGYLLYDFNLVLGDTFVVPQIANYGMYQLPLVVDLVDTVTLLNSQQRRRIHMTDGLQELEWVEGVGDLFGGLFYIYGFGYDQEQLVCVSDSTGPLWEANMSFYCDPNDPIPNAGPNTCGIFSFTTSVYDQSCNSCDGVISLTNMTGGTGPYSYYWSNAGTGSFNVNCCLGQNVVTIYDASGDSCSQSYYMGWNLPDFMITVDTFPCDGVDTLTIVPLSGVSPYIGFWSPPNTWVMQVLADSSGQYMAMMRDNAFCAIWKSIDVVNVELLQATPSVTPIGCSTCCDGNVNLNVAFGHPPYTVTSTPSFPTANNFCQGWYQYCVTDSMGCVYCDSVYVPGVTGIDDQETDAFNVYPNPAGDFIQVNRTVSEPTVLTIRGMNGMLVREQVISGASAEVDVSGLAEGVYFLNVDGVVQRVVVVR